MMLEAGSSRLRPWGERDLEDLVEAADDNRVSRNLTDQFPFPYQRSDGKAWLASCKSEPEPLRTLAIEVDGRAAGGIGLDHLHGERRLGAGIGYWLAYRLWGQGIVTDALGVFVGYAFKSFPVDRLQASVYGWNPASARVLEKCGFQLEGRLRGAIIKQDKVTDELLYGLMRSDYEDR